MIPKDISTKIGKAVSDKMKALSQLGAFAEARKKEQEAAPVAPAVPEKDVAGGGWGTPEQIKAIKAPVETPEPAMSDEERRSAQKEAADRAKRYRAALPSGGASKEALVEMRKTGEVADFEQPEKGFAERYDEDVRFQEEEYGEGSLERERALSEILGVGWRTKRASPRREDLIEKGRYAFDDLYEEAKAANPEGREEDWQDAAIKAYHRSKAEDASEFARTFEVEDTAQVSGKMEDYAAKRAAELREARLKREAEAAKKQGDVVSKAVNRVQGKAPTQPVVTPQQEAARKAMQMERDKQERPIPEVDTVDYTRTAEQEVAEPSPLLEGSEQELTDAEREELERLSEGVERSQALEEETERFRLDVAKQERAVQAATKRLEDLFEAHQVIADAPKKEDLLERSVAFQSAKYARARSRRDIPEMKNAQAQMKSAERQLQSLRQEVLNREALIRNLDPSNSVVFSPSEMMSGRVNLDRLQQVIQEAAGETTPEESPVEDLIADAIEEQGG